MPNIPNAPWFIEAAFILWFIGGAVTLWLYCDPVRFGKRPPIDIISDALIFIFVWPVALAAWLEKD